METFDYAPRNFSLLQYYFICEKNLFVNKINRRWLNFMKGIKRYGLSGTGCVLIPLTLCEFDID